MRRELGSECRKQFRRMIAAEFPEYHEDKSQIHPQGWYIWTRRHPDGLFFHILLVLHNTKDKFTTEAAWDFDGKLPGFERTDNVASTPAWFRTSRLWTEYVEGVLDDYWWPLVLRPKEFRERLLYEPDPVEGCLALVAPAVQDARDKLKQYVVPFFEEVVRRHGKA